MHSTSKVELSSDGQVNALICGVLILALCYECTKDRLHDLRERIIEAMPSISGRLSTSKGDLLMDVQVAYAVCSMVVFVVYYIVAEGAYSALLTISAILHCLGIVFLCIQVLSRGTATGVSVRSLLLDVLAICSRLSSTLWFQGYLPVDKTGDYVYQAVDICCLLLNLLLVCYVMMAKRGTYQEAQDSFCIIPVVAACWVLAMVFHADNDDNPLFDALWINSLFLEVMAVLPQLWLISQNAGQAPALMGHYIAAVALSRLMNGLCMWEARSAIACAEWIKGFNHAIYAIYGAHLLHLLLLSDFAYHYVRGILQTGLMSSLEVVRI